MYCENCGNRIEDDSKFCEYCGTPVEQSTLPYIECRFCHALNEADALFCENCGASLESSKKEGKSRKPRKTIFVIIGIVVLVLLILALAVFAINKLELFGSSSSSFSQEDEKEEDDDKDKKKEAEEEEEPEIDIDGTKAGETVSGIFTYSGNGEGSIDFGTEYNVYAVNEDGDEELLEKVESAIVLLDQVDDMVESQWNASNGYESSVEGEIYISEGEVYVQASEFEVTEAGYYDVTEDGINSYSYHVEDCTWLEAQQRAKEMGGTLVHINSEEEYDYILSEIASKGYTDIQFKIGGRRDSNSQDYYWVDENNQMYGEIINSSTYWCNGEWLSGEPSYKDGSIEESYLQIFWRKSENKWYWNDVPNDIISVVSSFKGKIGYIVEYED